MVVKKSAKGFKIRPRIIERGRFAQVSVNQLPRELIKLCEKSSIVWYRNIVWRKVRGKDKDKDRIYRYENNYPTHVFSAKTGKLLEKFK